MKSANEVSKTMLMDITLPFQLSTILPKFQTRHRGTVRQVLTRFLRRHGNPRCAISRTTTTGQTPSVTNHSFSLLRSSSKIEKMLLKKVNLILFSIFPVDVR